MTEPLKPCPFCDPKRADLEPYDVMLHYYSNTRTEPDYERLLDDFLGKNKAGQQALELLKDIQAYIDATDMDHNESYPSMQHCACLGRIESLLATLEKPEGSKHG